MFHSPFQQENPSFSTERELASFLLKVKQGRHQRVSEMRGADAGRHPAAVWRWRPAELPPRTPTGPRPTSPTRGSEREDGCFFFFFSQLDYLNQTAPTTVSLRKAEI